MVDYRGREVSSNIEDRRDPLDAIFQDMLWKLEKQREVEELLKALEAQGYVQPHNRPIEQPVAPTPMPRPKDR